MSPGSHVVRHVAARGLPSLNSNCQACTRWSMATLPPKVNFAKLRFGLLRVTIQHIGLLDRAQKLHLLSWDACKITSFPALHAYTCMGTSN
ncbi:hypothetical protein E2C01_000819 [Portunus trituberculatus]|uniref:Uncharacterized protein n=1 Tax=Portunus trituberculatus TaxID=210409 RepID=A0A5B7CG28_PORTR|nr:hypothetical protein [Portunus trituberculatus]